MKYKVLITNSDSDVNEWLRVGWEVHSVTAQHISEGGESSGFGRGKFCFVLKKEK